MVSWNADGQVSGYGSGAAASGSMDPAAWLLASPGTVDAEGPTRLQYNISGGGINRIAAQALSLHITAADCSANSGRRMTVTMFVAPDHAFPPGAVPSPSAILALGPNLQAFRSGSSRLASAGAADVTWAINGPTPSTLQANTKYWVLVIPTSVADMSFPANWVNDRPMTPGSEDLIGRAISIWTNRTPTAPEITAPSSGTVVAAGAAVTFSYTPNDPDKIGGSNDETYTDMAGIQVQYAARPTDDNPVPTWQDLPIANTSGGGQGKGWYIDGSAFNNIVDGALPLWTNRTMQIRCGSTSLTAGYGVLPSGDWQLRCRTFDYGHPQPTAVRPLGSTDGLYNPDTFPAANTGPWSPTVNLTVSAQVPPPILLSPVNATAIPDKVPVTLRWQYRNTHTPPFAQASRTVQIREVGDTSWTNLVSGSGAAAFFLIPEPTVVFEDNAEAITGWTGTGGDGTYPQHVSVSGNRIRNRKVTPSAGTNTMTLKRTGMSVAAGDQVVTVRGRRTSKADPGSLSAEKITNGGFNTNTSGWTIAGSGETARNTSDPFEGAGCLRMAVNDGESDTYWVQADQIITGLSASDVVNFNLATRYSGATARPRVTIVWMKSDNTTISSETHDPFTGSGWTSTGFTTSAPALANKAGIRLGMTVSSPNPSGQYVEWDAISVKVGTAPVASSIALDVKTSGGGTVSYELLSATNIGVTDSDDDLWEIQALLTPASGAFDSVTLTHRFGPGGQADFDITHVDVTTLGQELSPTTEFEWRVQVTDSNGVTSVFSEIGRFWVVPAPASGDVRPVPGDTIDAATLGCGKHRVEIYRRGGKRRVGVLSGVTHVDWNRVRDDISTAKIVVKSWDVDCGNLLAQLQTWAYEVVIFRDNGYGVERVWEGPITLLTYEQDAVTIQAKDVMAYAYRRIIKQAMNDAANGDTVTSRAARVLQNTLGPDDPNVLAYLQVLVREDDAIQHRSIPGYARTAFEEVDDMAANAGLDYTAVGRAILLWGTKHRIGTLPEFRDEDLGAVPIVSEYGMSMANRYVVSDGNGIWGEATRLDTDGKDLIYGLVEMLSSTWASDSEAEAGTYTAAGQATIQQSFEDYAERSIADRYPPPVIVRIPDGTTLNPSAVISIQQLVPGVAIPLRSTGTLRQVVATQKLDKVQVTEESDKESIAITLSPFSHDDASIDTDGGDA